MLKKVQKSRQGEPQRLLLIKIQTNNLYNIFIFLYLIKRTILFTLLIFFYKKNLFKNFFSQQKILKKTQPKTTKITKRFSTQLWFLKILTSFFFEFDISIKCGYVLK